MWYGDGLETKERIAKIREKIKKLGSPSMVTGEHAKEYDRLIEEIKNEQSKCDHSFCTYTSFLFIRRLCQWCDKEDK